MADKAYKRKIFQFTSPKNQVMVLMPVLAMLLFGAVVSFSFLGHLRDGAMMVMKDGGIPDDIIQNYANSVRALLVVFWSGVSFLTAVGFYWGWLVSHRIFGSFERLGRDLQQIREGKMSPSQLNVRENDYISEFVGSVRETLIALKKPN
jgi:hypothetical protein